MNLLYYIENFIDSAVNFGYIDDLDKNYIKNRIISILNYSEILESNIDKKYSLSILECLDKFLDYIKEKFWAYYSQSPEMATDYFYRLSQNSNYIKTRKIQRNIRFDCVSKYGKLEITINLSKPE